MQKHLAHNEGYEYVPIDEKEVSTSDFDLSVTLICKGYNLETIDSQHNGKLVFVFKNNAGISDVVEGYWSNRITVSPLDFANARKNLKSRIFGMPKNAKR